MRKYLVVMFLWVLFSGYAFPYCDAYPSMSIADESKESQFIIVGRVISRKIIVDPIEDPDGYEAEYFQVRIDEVLKGKPRKVISLFNVNTSARFLFDEHEKMLLFIQDSDDGYFVNSCGNSGVISGNRAQLFEVREIEKNRRNW